MAHAGSPIGTTPVIAALVGNALLTLGKIAVALASGSSALFSEAIHSIADTANQALLLVGLNRSRRKADADYGYGYGRERFFWALISACGIFFVGAGVTVYRGLSALILPETITIDQNVFVVLLLSFFVESATLLVAVRSIQRMFPTVSWSERVSLADPATLAVLLEDSVALLGVCVAAISIALSYFFESPIPDAIGSVMIGCMLAATAIILIVKNRRYLMGRAIPEELREEIVELLVADPAIEKVIDFKSTMLDINVYSIKCEVEMNGPALLKEAYKHSTLRDEYEEVKNDFEAFKRFCVDYADRIPRLIGSMSTPSRHGS